MDALRHSGYHWIIGPKTTDDFRDNLEVENLQQP